MTRLVKAEKISLLNHPEVSEKWIQDKIAEDPKILGLGELELRDKERRQPRAGRLDLYLQDIDGETRYEVEIQLGKTDESHIIRTIEYWDIEKKRYPKYQHIAVIVAEEITTRFLNVISLLNGTIPLIAMQMSAIKCGDDIALSFTKILDEATLGTPEEDEPAEPSDRNYWIERGSDATVKMADKFLEILRDTVGDYRLKYNKYYIGLVDNTNHASNFVILRPKKNVLNAEFWIPYSDEIQKLIDQAGADDIGYQERWKQFRIRLDENDLVSKRQLLEKLIKAAHDHFETS